MQWGGVEGKASQARTSAAPEVYFSDDLEKKSPNKLMGWQRRTFVVMPGTLQYFKPGKMEAAGALQKGELTRLDVDMTKRIAYLHTKTDRGMYELRCDDVARLRAFQKAMFNAFPKLNRERSISAVSTSTVIDSILSTQRQSTGSPIPLPGPLPVCGVRSAAAAVGTHPRDSQHGMVPEENQPSKILEVEVVPTAKSPSPNGADVESSRAVDNGNGFTIEYDEKAYSMKTPYLNGDEKAHRCSRRKKFEGLYENFKRHGRGVEYDEEQNKIFEGFWYEGEREEGVAYKNGQKWLEGTWGTTGFMVGREYNLLGQIKYEGQWHENLWHGIGTCYFEDGSKRYDGSWQYGEWHGDGSLYYQKTDVSTVLYRGQFECGECSGVGTCYLENGAKRYSGQWLEGDRHGEGELYNDNGTMIFRGQWVKNTEGGSGETFCENGKRTFKGAFRDGERADGTTYREDGAISYEGQWSGLLRQGKGKEYMCGTVIYDGEWQNNERDGTGTEFDEQGWRIYLGQWVRNKSEGYGVSYYETGEVLYEGFWLDGRRHGNGVEFAMDGKVIREGAWVEGEPPEALPLRKRDVAKNRINDIVCNVRRSLLSANDGKVGRRPSYVRRRRDRFKQWITNCCEKAKDFFSS
eukprot:GEMP01000483.1.p1 GENE.GEMP01000483.1~~GEMP01000483.1.p1  ORF type:complete len:633 (+),score=138.53 GEMP01000483.1:81-1979(+)